MSVRIEWVPSTYPDIASYNISVAPAIGGPFAALINIPHNLLGANYDPTLSKFFYVHTVGVLSNWYRLTSVDPLANESVPSPPIEPTSSTPTITNTVKVDHNYGSSGSLRYQTAGGVPVEAAIVRIYTKASFDQGEIDQPLAITLTDVRGNWVNPVYLTAGFTYTVQFAKEGLYGPDKTEIVV